MEPPVVHGRRTLRRSESARAAPQGGGPYIAPGNDRRGRRERSDGSYDGVGEKVNHGKL